MSIRLGRSRTCLRREKLLRARGAATRVVKSGCLPYGYEVDVEVRAGERRRGTAKYSERGGRCASADGWMAALTDTPLYTPLRAIPGVLFVVRRHHRCPYHDD